MGDQQKSSAEEQVYTPLSARMALNLAAPHTWAAAVIPCLVATAAAGTLVPLRPSVAIVLLAVCVLMQSSVNTFNDYYDYVKGADSADDNVEESDSVLVYNAVNPQSVKALAIGYLAAAFVLGAYIVYLAGIVPLVIGVVGAVFVVIYSAGKTPLSYLPLGEAVSGLVMGGLIPLACFYALTGALDWRVLLWAVPTIVGVGLIMLTNNTCDIEKDVEAKRRTLPVMLGRARSRRLYHGLMAVWVAAIAAIVAAFFPGGLFVVPFMLLATYPQLKALAGNPLVPASRIAAMGQVGGANVALGAFYAVAILGSACWLVW